MKLIPLLLLITILAACGNAPATSSNGADEPADTGSQPVATPTLLQPEAATSTPEVVTSPTPEASTMPMEPTSTMTGTLSGSPIEGAPAEGSSMAKVDAGLATVYQEYQAYKASGSSDPFTTTVALAQVVEDRVIIDATASADATILQGDLEALGLQNAAVAGPLVSGQLPIDAIAELGAVESLQFAQLSSATNN